MAIYSLGDVAPRIHPTAYVHPQAVIIGDVELGPEVSVWPCAVLRGDYNIIRVGARSNVQDGAVLHCTPEHGTVIGEDCTIGHLAHLEGCVVEDRSLIGTGAVILPEAKIGADALVGANATVLGSRVVQSRAMALGTPARVIENAIQRDQNLANARHYVENSRNYRLTLCKIS